VSRVAQAADAGDALVAEINAMLADRLAALDAAEYRTRVMLSTGLPSVRYGLELIDASKAAFGMRGRIVPLAGLLVTCAGWSYVMAAMTAEALANMTAVATGVPAARAVVPWGLAVLLLVYVLTCRGPKLFERVGEWLGPGMLVVASLLIAATVARFGARTVVAGELAPEQLYTPDR
jgi:purine-cytosine permease-like protein